MFDNNNLIENDDLNDLEEKGQSTKVTVKTRKVDYGIIFEIPELEVLSKEDLASRLDIAFPEYEFEII